MKKHATRAMVRLLLEKGMNLTREEGSWVIIMYELCSFWKHASFDEKTFHIETLTYLLKGRKDSREDLNTLKWAEMFLQPQENWQSHPIALAEIIAVILGTGVNPNSEFNDSTLWGLLVKAIDHVQSSNEALPQRSRKTILDLLKAILRCGADIDQILDRPLQKAFGSGAEMAVGKEIVLKRLLFRFAFSPFSPRIALLE